MIKNRSFFKGLAQYRKRKLSGSGFVLLFAVTISAILLTIALGVANIALKEVKFGTSARDTNDAFFAADTGIEYTLFKDKITGFYPLNVVTPVIIPQLGTLGQGCAMVTVDKTVSSVTTFISKGYNVASADGLCTSANPNSIERELKTTY